MQEKAASVGSELAKNNALIEEKEKAIEKLKNQANENALSQEGGEEEYYEEATESQWRCCVTSIVSMYLGLLTPNFMTERELRKYVKLIKKQNYRLISTIDRKEKME